jgi:hypothetical protein
MKKFFFTGNKAQERGGGGSEDVTIAIWEKTEEKKIRE